LLYITTEVSCDAINLIEKIKKLQLWIGKNIKLKRIVLQWIDINLVVQQYRHKN
jgi:hypothetical protein